MHTHHVPSLHCGDAVMAMVIVVLDDGKSWRLLDEVKVVVVSDHEYLKLINNGYKADEIEHIAKIKLSK